MTTTSTLADIIADGLDDIAKAQELHTQGMTKVITSLSRLAGAEAAPTESEPKPAKSTTKATKTKKPDPEPEDNATSDDAEDVDAAANGDPESESEITIEQIRAELQNGLDRKDAISLIEQFVAKGKHAKLSNVPVENYPKFLAAIKKKTGTEEE